MQDSKSEDPGLRWDLFHNDRGVIPQPHFCRDIDCFGTNPDHGLTWREVKEAMVQHHMAQAEKWIHAKESDYVA